MPPQSLGQVTPTEKSDYSCILYRLKQSCPKHLTGMTLWDIMPLPWYNRGKFMRLLLQIFSNRKIMDI